MQAAVLFALISCLLPAVPGLAQAQEEWLPCAPAPDAADMDADHLSDACELELASRFAPTLMIAPGGCNWDAENDRPGGGYFFAVQRVDFVIRVAYLPAYFRDCGWDGLKCWLPAVNCAPHAGDSEFIVVELRPVEGATTVVAGVFLSAHCFSRSGGDCRWYRGPALSRLGWSGTSPIIWVAEGRNANYPSKRACDRGHHSLDTCDRNESEFRFPITSTRNIGSRDHPFRDDGCIAGVELGSSLVEPDAGECFWRDSAFRGWTSAAPGVTGYSRYLADVAGF